jgi:hypothetical protein
VRRMNTTGHANRISLAPFMPSAGFYASAFSSPKARSQPCPHRNDNWSCLVLTCGRCVACMRVCVIFHASRLQKRALVNSLSGNLSLNSQPAFHAAFKLGEFRPAIRALLVLIAHSRRCPLNATRQPTNAIRGEYCHPEPAYEKLMARVGRVVMLVMRSNSVKIVASLPF